MSTSLGSARPLPTVSQVGPVDPAEIEAFHARHPAHATDDRRRWQVIVALEIATILVVWEILISVLKVVRPAFMPPPSAIIMALGELLARPTFPNHLMFSVGNLIVGVLLAAIVGITLGLAVGWSRFLDLTVSPIIWTIYSVPKVAFAPLVILALGLGPPSKVFLVFLLGVFPICLNTIEGVRTVDPSLVRAARVFGTRGARLLRTIILPATLPFILVGIRRAVALGFIGAMLGEFIGGNTGVGYLLKRAAQEFRMDEALAIVVVMIVIANLGLVITTLVQRRVAPWAR
ncbi:MAG: ABC transporter permease [Chloroflexi bacterium]|nr:ABC transporter permease [Chloroflexota bacterium]